MNGLVTILTKIAISLSLVLVAMGAASAVSERPVRAYALDTTSGPVWTSIPTRIDRSKQSYERIADRVEKDQYPLKFRAGERFRIIDGATFEVNGSRITLAGVKPLARQAICENGGKRKACGTHAFVALTKALNGQYVDCRTTGEGLFECRSNGRELSKLLSDLPG